LINNQAARTIKFKIKEISKSKAKIELRDNIIKSHQSPDRELEFFEEEEMNYKTESY